MTAFISVHSHAFEDEEFRFCRNVCSSSFLSTVHTMTALFAKLYFLTFWNKTLMLYVLLRPYDSPLANEVRIHLRIATHLGIASLKRI